MTRIGKHARALHLNTAVLWCAFYVVTHSRRRAEFKGHQMPATTSSSGRRLNTSQQARTHAEYSSAEHSKVPDLSETHIGLPACSLQSTAAYTAPSNSLVQHAVVPFQRRLDAACGTLTFAPQRWLIDAFLPVRLAQLARPVANVLAVHLPQRPGALNWVEQAHKAITWFAQAAYQQCACSVLVKTL